MRRMTIGLAVAGLLGAVGTAAAQSPSSRPSIVIGGDGARVLCASNQITQVVQVTAYAVDIVCAPGPSVGPHYVTLVAPSKARISCGKGGAPASRGVLRDRRLRPDMIDLDCR